MWSVSSVGWWSWWPCPDWTCGVCLPSVGLLIYLSGRPSETEFEEGNCISLRVWFSADRVSTSLLPQALCGEELVVAAINT